MNTESVVEFLSEIPLIQRLPSSSVTKIAELVKVKHYDEGKFVIPNGECEGVYFILEGEAEVLWYSVEAIHLDPVLKRYDYFGCGVTAYVVVASSKLTCLVLASQHCGLLQPKSIWDALERQENAPVESILQLDPIKVNLFQAITLPYALRLRNVFGGQLIGHALAAASKTVDCSKTVHHLQAYFLLVGDNNIPIKYEVHRVHDGKSFDSRRVEAVQKGNVLFTMLASFQKEGKGFEYQDAVMPLVPAPDMSLPLEELRERRIIDPRLPRTFRNKMAITKYEFSPIEIRFCYPDISTKQTKSLPRLKYWFRAKGKLSDDQALHRCVVAYTSDILFLEVSGNPHRQSGLKLRVLSLNHTMWFHRPVKADDWLLFVIKSPSSFADRGVVLGQMFNQNGELVVTALQEGLLRVAREPHTTIKPKL
ncbi:acyl-CoA hydrolase 2-like isoform X2 [Silene latifolia]|uniref:acyl-CoA hydrolase 2-like isoform X2 n=1 Tax=Silene latifolia TaxID=37657 RepID=UPI003D774C85